MPGSYPGVLGSIPSIPTTLIARLRATSCRRSSAWFRAAPCRGEGRGFESHRWRHVDVAQLAEHLASTQKARVRSPLSTPLLLDTSGRDQRTPTCSLRELRSPRDKVSTLPVEIREHRHVRYASCAHRETKSRLFRSRSAAVDRVASCASPVSYTHLTLPTKA